MGDRGNALSCWPLLRIDFGERFEISQVFLLLPVPVSVDVNEQAAARTRENP